MFCSYFVTVRTWTNTKTPYMYIYEHKRIIINVCWIPLNCVNTIILIFNTWYHALMLRVTFFKPKTSLSIKIFVTSSGKKICTVFNIRIFRRKWRENAHSSHTLCLIKYEFHEPVLPKLSCVWVYENYL